MFLILQIHAPLKITPLGPPEVRGAQVPDHGLLDVTGCTKMNGQDSLGFLRPVSDKVGNTFHVQPGRYETVRYMPTASVRFQIV